MKTFKTITTVMVLSLILGACNPIPRKDVANENEQQKIVNIPTVAQTSPIVEKREKNSKIEVHVEGQKEMRDATLTESTNLGYDLYVLKNFKFSAEEPGKDIIFSNYDNEFFVRIEKLENNINLDEFKTNQIDRYKVVGKVTNTDAKNLFIEKFKDSKFAFLVESGYDKKDKPKGSIMYVVKEFDGQLFAFTINMPLKEAAEGLTPSLWAMISTLKVSK